MRIKHFVKNLRCRFLRLGLFLAASEGLGLPMKDMTICYSVDAAKFKNWETLCKFAKGWGFDWDSVSQMETFPDRPDAGIRKREGALRLTFDILLRHISEQPEGWYILWHDDFIPNVDYNAYSELYRNIGTRSEVQIVAGEAVKYTWEEGKKRRNIGRWNRRRARVHPEFPLHRGVSGMENDAHLAVTPEGAKHLLGLFQGEHAGKAYEYSLFELLPASDRHVWTDLRLKVDNLWDIVGGDIWADGMQSRVGWNLAWDALRTGRILPLDPSEMKIREVCGAEWDLMIPNSQTIEKVV